MNTIGYVETLVALGAMQCCVRMNVLDADVPPILGITFLNQVNPVINWKNYTMTVKVGSKTSIIQCSSFKRGNEKIGKNDDVAIMAKQQLESSCKDDVEPHVGMDVENEFSGLPVEENGVACKETQKIVEKVVENSDKNGHICATRCAKRALKSATNSGHSVV